MLLNIGFNVVKPRQLRGQRGSLQLQALGYVNSTKVIFGDISRTDSVEIGFVDENDFVKEGKWYLVTENLQNLLYHADV